MGSEEDDERGFFSELPMPAAKAAGPKPHYHGHRERLRARFRETGAGSLSDYELLELLLFRVRRQDIWR